MQLDLPLQVYEPAPPQPRSGEGRAIFVRHRRARRYILRVLDEGTLRVTLPRWGSKREALAFVEQSAEWIARQRQKSMARPAIVHPNEAELRRRAARDCRRVAGAGRRPPRSSACRGSRCAISDSRWGACPQADRSP